MFTPELVVKVTAAAAMGAVCMWLLRRRRMLSVDQRAARLVVITGCDSGVGFSAAVHCHSQGFSVLALVLSMDSSGAEVLLNLGKMSGRLEVIGVDVTKPEQVLEAVHRATSLLENNKALVFHALINNAGVMVFGETEWQTEYTTSLQLDVNLTGAVRVTKQFAHLLRKYQGRVVNMSSHCASLPLPGLAVYAASKAGLQAWSDALRAEWAKYGVKVISIIPGAFFQQTNILSRQMQYARKMEEEMNEEAAHFYGQYYHNYQQHLSSLAGDKPATALQSRRLYDMLDSALLDSHPQAHYHNTPWRYSFYHTLALLPLTPTVIRDKLVICFTGMPAFKPCS